MCGILLIASGLEVACENETHRGPEAASPAAADFAEGLDCRGPDHTGCYSVACGSALFEFHGSLLQLRGTAPSHTPLVDAAGNVLVFNGQVFDGTLTVPAGANDAQLLLEALGTPGCQVPAVLTGLQGPWALVYWQHDTRTLWFGRDPIGRRSLLLHLPTAEDGRLLLSSSAPLDPAVPFHGFAELPPGMYSLELPQGAVPPAAAAAVPPAVPSAEAAPGAEVPAAAPPQGGDVGEHACPASCLAADPAQGSGPQHLAPLAGGSLPSSKTLAQFVRHNWTDPAVRQLSTFWRAPELESPPQAAEPAAAAAVAMAGADRGDSDPAGAAALAAGPGVQAAGNAAAEAPPSGAACGEVDAAAADEAFERSVDVVLAALRQAVAARCRCIDEQQRQQRQQLHVQDGLSGQQSAHMQHEQQQQPQQQGGRGEAGAASVPVDALATLHVGCSSSSSSNEVAAVPSPLLAGSGSFCQRQHGSPPSHAPQPAAAAAAGGGAAAAALASPPAASPVPAAQAAPAACSAQALPAPLPAPLPSPLLLPAPVLILFSGGVDSTLLAALAHEALPPGLPIDLASVCFDAGASPDRLSALDALAELRQLAPGRQWRLIQVDCTLADVEAARSRLLRLLAPSDTVMDLNIGAALWLAARGAGSLLQEGGGMGSKPESNAAGGQPRTAAAAEEKQQQQQQQELPGLCAGQRDSQQAQQAAQRTQAQAQPCPAAGSSSTCRSAARVVLLGHGADELFGGYGRHRTAFKTRGWEGLAAELALDLRRLWLRNLGRDDRLVADHGREARHPFLDERVVAAALAAPLHHLADLRLPPGTGDKRVLRTCLQRLRLPRAAARVKRAIQFGSRLAVKTNAAAFGGTRRANQRNAGSVRLADVPATVPADGGAPAPAQPQK